MSRVKFVGKTSTGFPSVSKVSPMISHPVRYQMFNLEFEDYEKNRMYLPGYRKESQMIKLSMQHVNAICHAEFFVDAATAKVPEPRMRHQLECDLLRLAELKLYIIETMTQPVSPFSGKPKPDGNKD